MKKIVLTGAPHSGKTTVISYLKAQRHSKTCDEAAVIVLDSLNGMMGPDGTRVWRDKYLPSFQYLITKTQLANEARFGPGKWYPTKEDELVFFDRGALDSYAFCKLFGQSVHPDVEAMLKTCKYDHVFVLDLITPFNERKDTGRTESEADARKIQQYLIETYKDHGYDPILVPVMPYEKRADFILDKLKDQPGVNIPAKTIDVESAWMVLQVSCPYCDKVNEVEGDNTMGGFAAHALECGSCSKRSWLGEDVSFDFGEDLSDDTEATIEEGVVRG